MIQLLLHVFPGVAQFGSALEWGSRGRRFDSCHSDHNRTYLLIQPKVQWLQFTHMFKKSVLQNPYIPPLIAVNRWIYGYLEEW